MKTLSRGRKRILPLLVLATTGVAGTFALAVAPAAGDAAKARTVLERSAAAYVAAPALVDVAHLEITMEGQPPQKAKIEYGFGPERAAYVRLPGLGATALDGRFYLTRDDVPDKFLEVDLAGDLAATMDALLQTESNLPVQFDMRAGRRIDEYLPALALGTLVEPRLVDHEMTTLEGVGKAHLVRVEGGNGESRVWIDAKSHLIRRIQFEAELPGPQPKAAATIDYAPDTKVSPRSVVEFDPTGRTVVASYEALRPTRIGAGSMAPDFALETLDGETVRLSDLRGQVVVLDFWATWCGPCRMGLPLLQDFDTWVHENDRPVRVFAIDTFERGETIDEWRKRAVAFWNKQSFSMPSLLDFENHTAIKYGVSGIPITYVIDREGRVARVHQGFDPGMKQALIEDIEPLLQ